MRRSIFGRRVIDHQSRGANFLISHLVFRVHHPHSSRDEHRLLVLHVDTVVEVVRPVLRKVIRIDLLVIVPLGCARVQRTFVRSSLFRYFCARAFLALRGEPRAAFLVLHATRATRALLVRAAHRASSTDRGRMTGSSVNFAPPTAARVRARRPAPRPNVVLRAPRTARRSHDRRRRRAPDRRNDDEVDDDEADDAAALSRDDDEEARRRRTDRARTIGRALT